MNKFPAHYGHHTEEKNYIQLQIIISLKEPSTDLLYGYYGKMSLVVMKDLERDAHIIVYTNMFNFKLPNFFFLQRKK